MSLFENKHICRVFHCLSYRNLCVLFYTMGKYTLCYYCNLSGHMCMQCKTKTKSEQSMQIKDMTCQYRKKTFFETSMSFIQDQLEYSSIPNGVTDNSDRYQKSTPPQTSVTIPSHLQLLPRQNKVSYLPWGTPLCPIVSHICSTGVAEKTTSRRQNKELFL